MKQTMFEPHLKVVYPWLFITLDKWMQTLETNDNMKGFLEFEEGASIGNKYGQNCGKGSIWILKYKQL